MEDMKDLLQRKHDWLAATPGTVQCYVRLTRELLVAILAAMTPPAGLPKIESRMLSPQEPPGTRRSPEEIARLLAERYGQTEEIRKAELANMRAS